MPLIGLLWLLANSVLAAPYPDRFVWVFGWNLNQESDVAALTRVIEQGAQHGVNGAMVSFGLDALCRKPPEFFRQLEAVKAVCERNQVELIPPVFSVGYGSSVLSHDRNLAEVCMGEPALYAIFEHEAKLLAERLRPRRVMLNMDEIRLGGTCRACRVRTRGELLGECITRQVAAIRRHLPDAQVYIWSDMLDPHHNTHPNYYLVEGDFTGSGRHVPCPP